MDKQALIDHMVERAGWARDRFGHLHIRVSKRLPHVDYKPGEEPIVTRHYRLKLQDTSCRIEIQTNCEVGPKLVQKKWVRLGGDFYSRIVTFVDPKGVQRVRIGSFFY